MSPEEAPRPGNSRGAPSGYGLVADARPVISRRLVCASDLVAAADVVGPDPVAASVVVDVALVGEADVQPAVIGRQKHDVVPASARVVPATARIIAAAPPPIGHRPIGDRPLLDVAAALAAKVLAHPVVIDTAAVRELDAVVPYVGDPVLTVRSRILRIVIGVVVAGVARIARLRRIARIAAAVRRDGPLRLLPLVGRAAAIDALDRQVAIVMDRAGTREFDIELAVALADACCAAAGDASPPAMIAMVDSNTNCRMDAPPDLRICRIAQAGDLHSTAVPAQSGLYPVVRKRRESQISLLQHAKTDMDQRVALVAR